MSRPNLYLISDEYPRLTSVRQYAERNNLSLWKARKTINKMVESGEIKAVRSRKFGNCIFVGGYSDLAKGQQDENS